MSNNYYGNIAVMISINSFDELKEVFEKYGMKFTKNQLSWFEQIKSREKDFLPFLTTMNYINAAFSADSTGRDAILKQIIPDVREFDYKEYELADPLGEQKYSPFHRFVHRYPDRALILLTDRCSMFCRHCFRRSFSGGFSGALSVEKLKPMIAYLASHNEIKEVLLTGGDPLTLSDERLSNVIGDIKSARSDLVIRLCSRVPVVNPDRITDAFISMLSEFSGLWFVTHYNHPAELTPSSLTAVKKIVRSGVPVLNQTVLLKDVNNSIEVLSELFQSLLVHGVKPYYLFQGDLAAGTSHLRVPLKEALQLTAELKYRISGMAMPRFAVDLPGGGGKITLPSQSHPITEAGEYFIIKGLDNEEYRYPSN